MDKVYYVYDSKYTNGSVQLVLEVKQGLSLINITCITPHAFTTVALSPAEIDEVMLLLLKCKKRAIEVEEREYDNQSQTKTECDGN